MCSAYSSELPRYGLKVGLKNYSAAYCTGLLLARRLLTSLKLDKIYQSVASVTGEIIKTVDNKETYYVKTVDAQRYPFTAYLDIGIKRSTLGARVFGALKGAVDGGLNIPHNEKRFPGYNKENKKYDPKIHRGKIYGDNIKAYMESLQKDEPEKYKSLFNEYIKAGIKATDLEKLYKTVHENIKKDPAAKLTAKKDYKNAKFANKPKRNLAQFKDRVKQIKARIAQE